MWRLFVTFLAFGSRAWGGPVAQIAAMKQAFVMERAWITVPKFQRVLAVYQVLPGPEATELACYFGYISAGRLGSIAAGLGFVLPGFILMLAAAVAYREGGVSNGYVQAAFAALQPAVHRIGEHAVQDPATHTFSRHLALCAGLAAVESTMGVNFFITLVHAATLYTFCLRPRRWVAAVLWTAAPLAAFIAVLAVVGSFDDLVPKAVGASKLGASPGAFFLVGLEGGLLTFGGAYTAIPVVQYEAVTAGGWLSQRAFLDAIAIGQVLPSPLVIFTTFVGYQSGAWAGAFLMTLGMFLPAFSFTIIGHPLFERLVEHGGAIMHLLDGVTAAVAGLILVSALQITFDAVRRPIDAVIFGAAMHLLLHMRHPLTPVFIVALAALAGIIFERTPAP